MHMIQLNDQHNQQMLTELINLSHMNRKNREELMLMKKIRKNHFVDIEENKSKQQ